MKKNNKIPMSVRFLFYMAKVFAAIISVPYIIKGMVSRVKVGDIVLYVNPRGPYFNRRIGREMRSEKHKTRRRWDAVCDEYGVVAED